MLPRARDLNRMLGEFGWSQGELINNYQALAALCAAVVVGHYAWSLWRGLRR